jgi:hypothetical protein
MMTWRDAATLHSRPEGGHLWIDNIVVNQVAKGSERWRILRRATELFQAVVGGGSEVAQRDDHHFEALLPGSRFSFGRSIAKAGILLLTPACLHVLRNYAISRGFSPPADPTWFFSYTWNDNQVKPLV